MSSISFDQLLSHKDSKSRKLYFNDLVINFDYDLVYIGDFFGRLVESIQ